MGLAIQRSIFMRSIAFTIDIANPSPIGVQEYPMSVSIS